MKSFYLLLIVLAGTTQCCHHSFSKAAQTISSIEWLMQNNGVCEIPEVPVDKQPVKNSLKDPYIYFPHFNDDSFIYIAKKGEIEKAITLEDTGFMNNPNAIKILIQKLNGELILQDSDLLYIQLYRYYYYQDSKKNWPTASYFPLKDYLENRIDEFFDPQPLELNYKIKLIDSYVDKLFDLHKESVPILPK